MIFWGILIFFSLLIFGFPLAWGIGYLIHQWFEHRETMQEKVNEELRLRIQLARANGERPGTQGTSPSSDPAPKDASWDDQVQTSYEMGYQQMQQRQ